MRSNRGYWLCADVHLCLTTNGVVLLDLRKDEYLGLNTAQVGVLTRLVEGWPAAEEEENGDEHLAADETQARQQAVEVADAMVEAGLLTTDPTLGKCATPVRLQRVDMTPIGQRLQGRPRIGFGHFANFILAYLGAMYALRRYPLGSVVARTQARKQHAAKKIARADRQDQWQLAEIFRRLQSFVYTSKDRCLFNSLALINFMARYDYFPVWVMGVRTNPFGAHSWVQDDAVVLDGRPESACFYTPILIV